MANVFISYSRRDQGFVRRLHDALSVEGRDTWVDWEDIPPTAEWMPEIYSAINAADTFVFVLSPDSVASDICQQELTHAVNQHKRLIPLVRLEVKAGVAPESLSKLNWIFFREQDDFTEALSLIARGLGILTLFGCGCIRSCW